LRGSWPAEQTPDPFAPAPAVRETKEESGIDCEITGLVGIYSDPKHVILYTSDGEGAGLAGRQTPGMGAKNLLGLPWRVALALQGDGWVIRNAIV
jgi:8-oxo-dGTP pyrophosphatase MutT (NUDIX family)